MDPTQKRRNPFDVFIEERVSETEPQSQQQQIQEPVYAHQQPVRTPKQTLQPQRSVYQQQTKGRQIEQPQGRDKYTSTMEKSLRRLVKIACVNRGIMFAQFVEEACREKLEREGMI